MPDIGIVLLAAGRGTRFGPEPKLLVRLDGKPLVRHAAEAALASRLRPIVVVLGAHGGAVRGALAGLDLGFVENSAYAEGLSTSLRLGLGHLPERCAGAVVLLGDMPLIRADHLDRLADAFRAEPHHAAVVPVAGGRRGNPVLLNRATLAPALAFLSGDRGAGPLLAGRDDIRELEMDEAVARDVDTLEALAALAPKP
ncbi:nucleotidyltransferase family protein [Methylobacterium iners]|uniref:Nicotine blue oxidoreductase n=1 Tax=Methylobacterium iners TaxID=418707 RepID=A0ABQ4RWP9_9HYPH|nr:nucleotidyltransferase family protein [Methylobacterium iners]GJD95081.1 Nicotine blue oxidoreductase [Methylobacterium iners]